MARKASSKPADSTANLWLAADSRGEAEPEHSGDSPARFSKSPGQTAEGNRSNTFSSAA